MKKLIGGEFIIDEKLVLHSRNIQREDILPLKMYASGRTALYAIIKACQSDKLPGGVLLPDYLCDSISQTVIDAGGNYEFYHINPELMPEYESMEKKLLYASAIVLINYFGILDLSKEISFIREIAPNVKIVIDDVQNYFGFGKEEDYDFAFTSLRKWFPVPDGALVMPDKDIEMIDFYEENKFADYKFAGNILKNYRDFVSDELCLELINSGERILDEKYLCKCSKVTPYLLKAIDYNKVAVARKGNAEVLHEGLAKMGIKHFYNKDVVPMFVPIILPAEKRSYIRKNLFDHNIFSPIHWPWISEKKNGCNELYKTELSLICDQRYTKDDMEFILETLEYGYKSY